MIKNVTAYRDSKQLPAAAGDPDSYAHMRAGHYTIDNGVDWLAEFNRLRGEWSGGKADPIKGPPGRVAPTATRQPA
jgi:hypothetical protein